MKKRKTADETLSLFGDDIPASPYAKNNGERLRRWASKGIYLGTSSWKYPGWKGLIYQRAYPSKKLFEAECLTEYAAIFPTVCADFALYDFPDPRTITAIHEQTGEHFRVSFKVTDRITVRRYPNLPRHGHLAGTENPDFLNVELFEDAFLHPLEILGKKCGAIIFEFSTFYSASGVSYGKFVELLDAFLGRLPAGFAYTVELRNREFLTAEYLSMLARHNVGHVLNNWTRMPPIIEQVQMSGILTAPVTALRGLLKVGRTYQEAVEAFQPYETIREVNEELRAGVVEAVRRSVADNKILYAYINNRVEGNSPKTIEAILDTLDRYPEEKL